MFTLDFLLYPLSQYLLLNTKYRKREIKRSVAAKIETKLTAVSIKSLSNMESAF